MTLLDECKALESGYNGMSAWSVVDEIDDVEIIEDKVVDRRRWVVVSRAILKRGDEVVGLSYESPATEYQEGGDFNHEFYAVEPYEVTVTKYRKV